MGKYKQQHADARRAERTYPVCLRGDLNADWQAANRRLQRAQSEARLSDSKEGAGLGPLIDEVRALEAQMLEHTEEWRLRALPRYEFRELVAAHPQRLGDDKMPIPEDRMGVNWETILPPLVRASLVSPELDEEDIVWLFGHSDAERKKLMADGKADEVEGGVLNDRQVEDLRDLVWDLNRDQVSAPFSQAASLATLVTGSE